MIVSVDPFVHVAAAGAIAVVFARAILEKSSDFVVYAATLRDYRLIPEWLAPFAAVCLFVAEISVLAALALPETRAAGAIVAMALLALYGLAMALALAAGREEIECGCGGQGQIVSWALVARNVGLIVIAGLVVAPQTSRALSAFDLAQAVCAILVFWLALAIVEKTIESQAAVRRLRAQSFL
ncbi:MAG: hypothetical protein H6871_07125 [Methylobacteriaceae bacterium]|nr:hypothetical protein [Methylobacteriaceae bacterium]MCC0002742.1 hypothetical protein [Methylobacteriaceae bacterium]